MSPRGKPEALFPMTLLFPSQPNQRANLGWNTLEIPQSITRYRRFPQQPKSWLSHTTGYIFSQFQTCSQWWRLGAETICITTPSLSLPALNRGIQSHPGKHKRLRTAGHFANWIWTFPIFWVFHHFNLTLDTWVRVWPRGLGKELEPEWKWKGLHQLQVHASKAVLL